jgi:DNA-binding LytR/AlgR family response regulator
MSQEVLLPAVWEAPLAHPEAAVSAVISPGPGGLPAGSAAAMPDSPIRVLLVEDEPLFAEQLEAALQDLGYEVVGPAADARIALALHRTETIDLALLDVQLRGATDGVELAQQLLAHRPIPLIFLTSRADGETFGRAQQLGPAAYLTKPVAVDALQRAIALALRNFSAKYPAADTFLQAPGGEALPDTLFIKENGMLEKIRLSEVQWVTADDKHCRLTLAARTVQVRMPLRELVRHLPAESFVQIQRSYYVNLNHIERLDTARHLVQVGEHILPVSRTLQDELLRRLRTIG